MTHVLQAQILQFIGNDTTAVSDDVINYVFNLLQIQCDNNSELNVGYFSPAEKHLLMQEPTNQSGRQIPSHKKCILIHPLEGHWLTSFYNNKRRLYVWLFADKFTLLSNQKADWKNIWGIFTLSASNINMCSNRIIYLCGVFAIAFAVSLTLDMDPSDLQYDQS